MKRTILRLAVASLATLLVAMPRAASAHFLWITVAAADAPRDGSTVIRTFLNETPEPGGPQFLKAIRGVKVSVDGRPLPLTQGEESYDARWAGKLPPMIDAERDFGIKTAKDGKVYRLYYTARAQSGAASADDKPGDDGLRVRLVTEGDKSLLQVHFAGKAAAKVRVKAYPETGDPRELTADDRGLASIDGLAEGKTAVWANWVDPKAGELDGKPFAETRHYATLTFRPQPAVATGEVKTADLPTAFATMPGPAVNSFGGAVLGDWLYVYSGHVGKTHEYSVETTSRHFRRLNLKDRTTWEDLPMSKDVQGVALVADGTYVYRVGGMSARNRPGTPHDLYSVADFARFDPESKTWTDLAPMPTPRSTHDAVVIGRKVYAVGGWSMKGETEKATYVDDSVVFDLDRPEAGWKAIGQPFRRRALSAAEHGGRLYVLGGLNDDFKVERRVDVYDPATGSWKVGPELPVAGKNEGFGTSAFGVLGSLYYSGVAGRIFRLDAVGTAWEPVGAWSLPRITHRLLPGPGATLLAVGGNAKGKQTPVIEAIPLPLAAPATPGGE